MTVTTRATVCTHAQPEQIIAKIVQLCMNKDCTKETLCIYMHMCVYTCTPDQYEVSVSCTISLSPPSSPPPLPPPQLTALGQPVAPNATVQPHSGIIAPQVSRVCVCVCVCVCVGVCVCFHCWKRCPVVCCDETSTGFTIQRPARSFTNARCKYIVECRMR